ncbi:MAG TPA: transposase [Stellaceae bacterium]|jgi:REP element-mobilizing transposase RayT
MHTQRRLRLKEYDYSAPGAYFVTVCVTGRRCLLGTVVDGRMVVNDIGIMVERQWLDLPARFPALSLDAYVVMPNHLHGIVVIELGGPSLVSAVGAFKSLSSRLFQIASDQKHPLWQRSFHDHALRNEQALAALREYIVNNPAKWHLDRENPAYR